MVVDLCTLQYGSKTNRNRIQYSTEASLVTLHVELGFLKTRNAESRLQNLQSVGRYFPSSIPSIAWDIREVKKEIERP